MGNKKLTKMVETPEEIAENIEIEKAIAESTMIADFVGLIIRTEQCNAYMDPIEYEMVIDCPDFLDHDEDLLYLYEADYPHQLQYQFHSDWKWLMGAVSKIENLRGEDRAYLFSVDTGRDYCIIRYNDFIGKSIAVSSEHNDKMETIYRAVIRFIEWYNKQDIKLMAE